MVRIDSAFDRCPVEIWHEVLMGAFEEFVRLKSWRLAIEFVITVSHICHKLRNVALIAQKAWTVLLSSMPGAQVDTFLGRSQMSKLIVIFEGISGEEDTPSWDNVHARPLWRDKGFPEKIWGCNSRIQTLIFGRWRQASRFPTSPSYTFQLTAVTHLDFNGYNGPPPNCHKTTLFLPRLIELRVRNTFLLLNAPQVESLTVVLDSPVFIVPDSGDFRRFLRSLPTLKRVEFDVHMRWIYTWLNERASLPSVKTLALSHFEGGGSIAVMKSIVEHIDFPGLSALEINVRPRSFASAIELTSQKYKGQIVDVDIHGPAHLGRSRDATLFGPEEAKKYFPSAKQIQVHANVGYSGWKVIDGVAMRRTCACRGGDTIL